MPHTAFTLMRAPSPSPTTCMNNKSLNQLEAFGLVAAGIRVRVRVRVSVRVRHLAL